MQLNAYLASTSHPQCLACMSHGPKPNFRRSALKDTVMKHCGASGQFYLPRQYPIILRRQSSRYNTSHFTCVIGHVFSATSLDGSTPLVINEDPVIVLPVLLYACETWTVLAADERRLEAFHMKCQRQISKIRWQDTSGTPRSLRIPVSARCWIS